MRIVLVLLLSVIVHSAACAQAQQPQQSYTVPTYSLPTYAPQTYTVPTFSPPAFTPQTGPQSADQARPKPRRRMVKCMRSDDPEDYCVLPAGRDFRYGAPCSCDGIADARE